MEVHCIQKLYFGHKKHRRVITAHFGTTEIEKKNEAITKEFKDRIAVLTIAYHNLGVEQEFM